MAAQNFDRYIPFDAAESLILEVVDEIESMYGNRLKRAFWAATLGGAALGTGIVPIVGTALGAVTGALGSLAFIFTANSARDRTIGKWTHELIGQLTVEQLHDVIRILSVENSFPVWSKSFVIDVFRNGEMEDAVERVLGA